MYIGKSIQVYRTVICRDQKSNTSTIWHFNFEWSMLQNIECVGHYAMLYFNQSWDRHRINTHTFIVATFPTLQSHSKLTITTMLPLSYSAAKVLCMKMRNNFCKRAMESETKVDVG